LRVCEKRVLRRIFGPKGKKVARDWKRTRKSYYGEEITENLAEHVARMRDM